MGKQQRKIDKMKSNPSLRLERRGVLGMVTVRNSVLPWNIEMNKTALRFIWKNRKHKEIEIIEKTLRITLTWNRGEINDRNV